MKDANRRVSLIVMFLLVTGARLNSALHARWADIDLDSGVWVVPATIAKSKRANPHYLNESAIWVLKEALAFGKGEYVFPSPDSKTAGKPFTTITRVWYRLRKAAGLSNKVRLHDLRHTWAKLVLAAGFNTNDLQYGLNHADIRTTARYQHMESKRMREVASAASVIVRKPVVIEEAKAKAA